MRFGDHIMRDRIPSYFQLQKYNITPEDVVKLYFHCEPAVIQPKVIVTPYWHVERFSGNADSVTTVFEDAVYQLEYNGQVITFIRTGIGAPQTGDAIVALGCTPCETIVFTGSVGGLSSSMEIGDLIVTEKSICGDGFSRYLDADVPTKDCFFQPVEPDPDLTKCIDSVALEHCQRESVPLHRGNIFSTDSIIAQFFRLDYIVENFDCIGIEMETAALFRAAKLVGIKAAALLQLSDVIPTHKSLFSGRTEEDMERRRHIRENVLIKAIFDSLTVCA
jgi:purine-nucleoside phosphorylase